ncbi:MAG TPA: type IVB secretion system protein IcmH/DotU [Pyrinomonadaceae bacterium]|nr:type IVB secretion system protein IcmH/DotU [Pyrinomonadaceae bacterium]
MQSAVIEHQPAAGRRRYRGGTDLVTLAGPILELVMKLRAGLLAPSNELRQMVQSLLSEMEQRGATLRYSESQINAVKFALTAFVDETVLTANFPLREEWEKDPLQLEHFREHLAGVKFFEKLDELLKNMETDAGVVEVYYLCMLLGFKGQHQIYMEDKLQKLIENTAAQLRRVGRLSEGELSPHWSVTDQPEPRRDPGVPLWLKISAIAVFGLAVLVYIILLLVLRSDVNAATYQLLS